MFFSDPWKAQLIELVEVVGFENWRESAVAEALLDDPNSVLGSPYAENTFELVGFYDGDFVHVHIYWEAGKQPRVKRVEQERLN